jgi:hypothetical protein
MRARIALTALVAAFAAGSAVAQDNQTDEPRRIKPLFGDSEKQTTAEPKRDQTDDEFDGD